MTRSARHTAQLSKPLTAEDLEGDLIQPGHSLFGIVWINKQRMSGAPCFSGTRVPIKTLFDYVEGGEPLEEFLEDFEGVTRDQAEALLALACKEFLEKLPKERDQEVRVAVVAESAHTQSSPPQQSEDKWAAVRTQLEAAGLRVPPPGCNNPCPVSPIELPGPSASQILISDRR